MKIENEKSRVYRYKTLEEIAEALVKYNSLGYEREYDDDFFPHYYIHINEDDFSFVNGCGCYTEDFCAPYGGVCDDDSFEWETLDNKDFRNVCEDLLEQVNLYIKERELEDD